MFRYGFDRLTVSKALQILDGKVKTLINDDVRKRLDQSHQIVQNIAAGENVVYGINTGFGPLCNTMIAEEDRVLLQENLLKSHSVGIGDPLKPRIVKLMMILKVHALCKGYSGISYEIIARILWFIEKNIIPWVPEQGSVGASGDLAPLSHLFLPLIGEGKVYYKGKLTDTKSVLYEFNLKPLSLHPKAGLALINGTQFILAHAVFLIDNFYSCLAQADIIAALMIDGIKASNIPFHPLLHETRPFSGNTHVAARISKFLDGSPILKSHEDCGRVQDPYSLRCIPQVHGSSRHAWLHLKELVETELNSVTDNPVILAENLIVSGGSFHGQPLALPIDYLCLAASELGNISDRRIFYALDTNDEETPKFLMRGIGLNSGFMILQYTTAALASENKTMSFPSSVDSIPTSLGQEDHVSMGPFSARKAITVVENVKKILAIELICAAQAMDFRRPLSSTAFLDDIHACIRDFIPFVDHDQIVYDFIQKGVELIRNRCMLDIEKKHFNGEFSAYDALYENF